MSSISLGLKTSFSTNSSLYSTPCQSPGSLGSSLDSTHLSLQSKESLTTTGPSDNGGLLAIQCNQDSFNSNGRNESRTGSCSSGSSLNSVRTLLPPSTTISSTGTWKPDHCNLNKSQDDPSKSISYSNNVMQSLFQLRQDLTLKLSGLRQQVQLVVYQLNELEVEMEDRLNSMCQLMNNDFECKSMNGTAEVNGTYLISPIGETRKSIAPVPNELRLTQLNKLIKTPALEKLPAIVKGYLTRRLMQTSKVKNLIKTIKDTTILLDNYHSEEQVAQEEIDFHRRLMIQLEKSLAELHDVFFTQNKSEQMKLISRTREVAVEKVLRLSTEARRLQAEKARKFVHDKRKDSPLLTNTSRSVKQSRKDEPLQNETEKDGKVPEERPENKKEDKPEERPEEKLQEIHEKKLDEKQDADIEMKSIEHPIEAKLKPKPKTNTKAKAKAPAKPRKGAKNTKKVSSSSEEAESTNPSSISSESAIPTPPSLPPPSTPSPTTTQVETSETSKSTKETTKESPPKRPKRAVSAVKRVTRAAKKS